MTSLENAHVWPYAESKQARLPVNQATAVRQSSNNPCCIRPPMKLCCAPPALAAENAIRYRLTELSLQIGEQMISVDPGGHIITGPARKCLTGF